VDVVEELDSQADPIAGITVNEAFVNDMNELAKFMVQKGALKEPINWATEINTSFLREVAPKLVAASGR
jgi:hypothetical protein